MAIKSTTQACTVTTDWEWGQNGGDGTTKDISQSYTIAVLQQFAWDGAYWNPVGSIYTTQTTQSYSDADGFSGELSIQSNTISGTVEAPTWNGSYFDQRTTNSGGGTATFSGTVKKTASFGWGAVSTSHNHSSSVYYDDGTYAGNLPVTSCSGYANAPSYNGSSIGETAQTTGTGTANYSGEVPLKSGGGTDPDPDPGGGNNRPNDWSWSTLTSYSPIYSQDVIKANLVTANEWINFCTRINEFRNYKGFSSYSFSTVSVNQIITSSNINQAINAISTMAPVTLGAGPYSTLINLRNALNSIQ